VVVVSVTPELGLDFLNNYSGGLGVLEGDKFLAAASLGIDYVVLTLLYPGGYVDYDIYKDRIVARKQSQPTDFENILVEEKPLYIDVKGDKLKIIPRVYKGGNASAVFLDVESPEWARDLVERLYIESNEEEKQYKYIVLAKAAASYIRERIGVEHVEVVDLQEAYTTLLSLALPEIKRYRFITHTPGPWGHPRFKGELLRKEFNHEPEAEEVSLTILGFEVSEKVFAVSKKHYEITKSIYPEYEDRLSYVTNGVYISRWLSSPMKDLLKKFRVYDIDLPEFKKARTESRFKLEEFLENQKPGLEVNGKPILVWARRLTRYKRPYFIKKLVESGEIDDAVLVLSGKPHPYDKYGLQYLKDFVKLSRSHENVVYINYYDVKKAATILTSADIHLFTPFSGWEACGTSYMKSLINGVPILSSRDGGVLELVADGVNSWLFGRENRTIIKLDSDEAREMDEMDYVDLEQKLKSIIDIWDTEKYWQVSLNAFVLSQSKASIERSLREYYPWKFK
jgi:starch phosphorylase